MKTELLSLRELSKSFDEREILHGISLRIYQGETTFLIGAANSGKSVLSKLLTGELFPDAGSMSLCGAAYMPVSIEQAHRRGVFYASPGAPLMENLTVAENIGLSSAPLSLRPRDRSQMHAAVYILCEKLGIHFDLQKKAQALSPLEMLLIHCVRAVCRRARLLIIEGFLSLLSEEELAWFFQRVLRFREHGLTLLLFESSYREGLLYGDRCLFLFEGQIVADFPRSLFSATKFKTLCMESISPLPPLPANERLSGVSRFFSCRTPDGTIRSLSVKCGEIYGISCRSMNQYQSCLQNSFSEEAIHALNQSPDRERICVVDMHRLQHGYYPDMSFKENILFPLLGKLARYGFFHPNQLDRLFQSEFARYLTAVPSADWNKKLYQMGNLERSLAVLYRVLLEDSEILVLSGITDVPNPALHENLRQAITLAAERKKAVILYSRNHALLKSWCGSVTLLDSIDISNSP